MPDGVSMPEEAPGPAPDPSDDGARSGTLPEGVGGPVLVGGVGYRNLRDFSVGPAAADRLAAEDWPAGVEVEDLSYNPVAAVHRMSEASPPYGRLVLVAAARRGRSPGTVTAYRWDRRLPDEDHVQERVAEAVTGVIDLDNLLVVLAQFEALPAEVVVVEVEPQLEEWGEEFTPTVADAFERALRTAREAALATPGTMRRFPRSPLGGVTTTN